MIELARTRARERQLSVDFIIGDAQAFSFPAQTFDVLVSRFGVMFFDDPPIAHSEICVAPPAPVADSRSCVGVIRRTTRS